MAADPATKSNSSQSVEVFCIAGPFFKDSNQTDSVTHAHTRLGSSSRSKRLRNCRTSTPCLVASRATRSSTCSSFPKSNSNRAPTTNPFLRPSSSRPRSASTRSPTRRTRSGRGSRPKRGGSRNAPRRSSRPSGRERGSKVGARGQSECSGFVKKQAKRVNCQQN